MSPTTESGPHRKTPPDPGPIVFIAIGSRGDVQPCVALGRGLRRRGHRIRIATSGRYEALVVRGGLEFAPVTLDVEQIWQGIDWRDWQNGTSSAALKEGVNRILLPLADTMLAEAVAASAGARAIIGPSWLPVGYHIAESQGVPCAFLQGQPWEPTRAFPHLELSRRSLGGWANHASYLLVEQVLWLVLRRWINRWRSTSLGLEPISLAAPARAVRRRGLPVFCRYSPLVVPLPPDWGPHMHVTGYLYDSPPATWTPPPDLAGFLEGGEPPVYVGFGSWQPSDAAEVHRLVAAALRRAGVRGLLAGADGAGDPGRYGPDMFVVGRIPHEWLFPRCAAVVHHGGNGTVGTGLRAGVPNVVVPFVTDQPFWGSRVAALGAGPEPIPIKRLSAERLGDAVRRAVTDPAMRAAAADLGRRLRAENGVERACDLVEEWLAASGGGAEGSATPGQDRWIHDLSLRAHRFRPGLALPARSRS